MKSTAVNDNISENDHNNGYKNKNNSEVDISVKTILDIIVKKNISDLKIVKWIIHKDYFRLFMLDNFEDEIYQDLITLKFKLCCVNCDPRLKLGPLNIF